jgi:hypothetical protein
MTKSFLSNSSLAAIATAFVMTVSLSSANAAGWGHDANGNPYGGGGTPVQESTPSRPSTQTGGNSGNNTRPLPRPSSTYGGDTYQTNNTPNRWPYPPRHETYVPIHTYNDRPVIIREVPVPYYPKRDTYEMQTRETPRYPGPYFPKRDTYQPSQTYNDRPSTGTSYPQKRDTWETGAGYGGSQTSRPTTTTTSSWDKSGGYGGK